VLESLKSISNECISIFITSDKCYENLEWDWGYREIDRIGGIDPYSASKGGAELAINSYSKCFFKEGGIKVGIGRAGNVIGGGDWSIDRIIPDLIRSIKSKKILKIRYPNSTRPWQHVLEPIYGYLFLAQNLFLKNKNNGESFNFGPKFKKNYKVNTLLQEFRKYLPQIKWKKETGKIRIHEAGLLNLNSNKSFKKLKWKNILNFRETIKMTAEWYLLYLNNNNVKELTINQLRLYKKKLNKNIK